MSSARRLRVLVVDDSTVQRQILTKLLVRDPEIELAGTASNGAEAVRAVARLRPDVVTLDDRMPVMSGLEAARHIMRETPTPIVMISAATGDDARKLSDAALAAGVLSVQGKRALSAAEPAAVSELVRLIKGMAEVRVVRRRREPVAGDVAVFGEATDLPNSSAPLEIVAIGASTGGPQALREVISRLPGDFPLPVLVVQHTTNGYSSTLVEWLSTASKVPVKLAEDGHRLDRGGVYIAPTGRHLVVRGRLMILQDTPPVSLHRPSATMLFRSVAEAYGPRSLGILLTGMGDDGAAGLLSMKECGALTIAQEENSCVVFGMPAEAIRLGAADCVVRPDEIAPIILGRLARKEGPAWI